MTALFFGIILSLVIALIMYGACFIVIAFTLWMVVDAAKQDRFWWVLLIVAIPFVGSALYFFTEKKHEYAKAESHHVHQSQTEEEHEKAPTKKHHPKSEEHAPVLLAQEDNASSVKEVTEEHEHKDKHTAA
jgi:ABC-type nickel/cobalt efflux system permease component RcnA